MDYSNFMDVLNSCNKLWEDANGLIFIDSLILDNIVKQLSLLHVLHDQEQLLGCFNNLV